MNDNWKSRAARKAAGLIVEGRAVASARSALVDRVLALRGEVEAAERRLIEAERFESKQRPARDDAYRPSVAKSVQSELDDARDALASAQQALSTCGDEAKIRLGIEAARIAAALKLPVGV